MQTSLFVCLQIIVCEFYSVKMYKNETYFYAEFYFNEEHNRLEDTATMQQ